MSWSRLGVPPQLCRAAGGAWACTRVCVRACEHTCAEHTCAPCEHVCSVHTQPTDTAPGRGEEEGAGALIRAHRRAGRGKGGPGGHGGGERQHAACVTLSPTPPRPQLLPRQQGEPGASLGTTGPSRRPGRCWRQVCPPGRGGGGRGGVAVLQCPPHRGVQGSGTAPSAPPCPGVPRPQARSAGVGSDAPVTGSRLCPGTAVRAGVLCGDTRGDAGCGQPREESDGHRGCTGAVPMVSPPAPQPGSGRLSPPAALRGEGQECPPVWGQPGCGCAGGQRVVPPPPPTRALFSAAAGTERVPIPAIPAPPPGVTPPHASPRPPPPTPPSPAKADPTAKPHPRVGSGEGTRWPRCPRGAVAVAVAVSPSPRCSVPRPAALPARARPLGGRRWPDAGADRAGAAPGCAAGGGGPFLPTPRCGTHPGSPRGCGLGLAARWPRQRAAGRWGGLSSWGPSWCSPKPAPAPARGGASSAVPCRQGRSPRSPVVLQHEGTGCGSRGPGAVPTARPPTPSPCGPSVPRAHRGVGALVWGVLLPPPTVTQMGTGPHPTECVTHSPGR